MKVSKKILVALVMAASMAVVSSTAFAAPKGQAEVKAAIENTLAGITAAQEASKAGDLSGISKAIGDARQAQKEFRYEGTERQRQKANDKLRVARESFEAGDTAAGDKALAEALKSFTEMKAVYDASHK
jgi:large subunit ribosomal protein L7/L12